MVLSVNDTRSTYGETSTMKSGEHSLIPGAPKFRATLVKEEDFFSLPSFSLGPSKREDSMLPFSGRFHTPGAP